MKQRMLATEWTIPVYFVEADAPRVQDMISSSANNDATKAKGKVDLGPLLRGSFRLKVEAEQPSAHTALTAPALHMHLRGTTDDDAILIVAHYDTYGAIPVSHCVYVCARLSECVSACM